MLNSMINRNVSGYFDPLTLSIYEQKNNPNSWRKRVMSKIETLQYGDNPDIDIEDQLALSVSIHENDHYIRYCSNEIGLLISFLHHQKYSAKLAKWKIIQGTIIDDVQNQQNIIDEINFLITGLNSYDPKITQKDIVDKLNLLFFNFGFLELPFYTKNPNNSHCPHPNLNFQNLLEASAIFAEVMSSDVLRCNYQEFALYLNGIFKYHSQTYKSIFSWTLKELDMAFPIAALAVRLSLDSRVPLFGSPFISRIDWEDFHPGYRLIKIMGSAKKVLNYFSTINFDYIFKSNHKMYAENIENLILSIMMNSITNDAKLLTWDNYLVKSFTPNLDVVYNNFSKLSKEAFKFINNGSTKHIFNHQFDSFNSFKQWKYIDPVNFFFGTVIVDPEDNFEEKRKKRQDYFAIFSIFDNIIDSVYLNDPYKFIPSITRHFHNIILESLLNGENKNYIIDTIDKYHYFNTDQNTDKILKQSIFQAATEIFGIKFNYNNTNHSHL